MKCFIIFINQFRYNTATSCIHNMTTPGMTTPPEELATGRATGFGSWATTREPAGPLYCKDDELDYSNWENKYEPNNANNAYGGEDCVELRPYTTMNDGGVWNDIRCSYRNYYLCEKGKNVFFFFVFLFFVFLFFVFCFLRIEAFSLFKLTLFDKIQSVSNQEHGSHEGH